MISSFQPEHSLDSYGFDLPTELIAQKPVSPRDYSRLMVIDRKNQTWSHHYFYELPEILGSTESPLLVANNTKVIPARLLGYRKYQNTGKWVRGGKVEFLLLKHHKEQIWEGIFHSAARQKPGLRFEIPLQEGGVIEGELLEGASQNPQGTVTARFSQNPLKAGHVPLPPYLRRDIQKFQTAWNVSHPEEEIRECYQTVFSKKEGSAAAPTAGFHFTSELLEKLQKQSIEWLELTLHVGLGTFRPVKTKDIREHQMHRESYEIPEAVAKGITAAKQTGRKVIAIGTTSSRALESAWDSRHQLLRTGNFETELFLYPDSAQPPRFQVVDHLITNFHLPHSTLLMLVCAFAGQEFILEAYREAIAQNYRFYSFGDAMLIL